MEELAAIRAAKRDVLERERASRDERERLEAEENAILGLIGLKRAIDESTEEADVPDLMAALRESLERARREESKKRSQTPAAAQRLPTRQRILALMISRPEADGWTPSEVQTELRGAVPTLTGNNTRVTLRRMVERGELVRLEDGRYRLPEGADQLAITESSVFDDSAGAQE